jgi:outer membrane protein OmpA-like peptidoglycan-associated protein
VKLYVFLGLFWFYSFVAFSQKIDYGSCSGQVLVSVNANYKLNFPGSKGIDKSNLFGYLSGNLVSRNAIWICYESENNGDLKVNCKTNIDSLHFVVFKTDISDACHDIQSKKAEVIFTKANTNCSEFENAKMELKSGYKYSFVFLAKEKITDNIDVQLDYLEKGEDGGELLDTLSLNLVYDRNKPIYSVHILDELTRKPIKSRIVISNADELDGTYKASDLFLNYKKQVKEAVLKVDAEGYLSKDLTKHKIILANKVADTILLTPVKRGTIAKLDEIYFAAGLAIILEESDPKLKRLRDFMILNPSVNIEIQGHVNDESKRGLLSKRLSKRRAQRILSYLVDCGISESRMSAVGFGNSKPVYKNPKSDEEKEANRRVEILIK